MGGAKPPPRTSQTRLTPRGRVGKCSRAAYRTITPPYSTFVAVCLSLAVGSLPARTPSLWCLPPYFLRSLRSPCRYPGFLRKLSSFDAPLFPFGVIVPTYYPVRSSSSLKLDSILLAYGLQGPLVSLLSIKSTTGRPLILPPTTDSSTSHPTLPAPHIFSFVMDGRPPFL